MPAGDHAHAMGPFRVAQTKLFVKDPNHVQGMSFRIECLGACFNAATGLCAVGNPAIAALDGAGSKRSHPS